MFKRAIYTIWVQDDEFKDAKLLMDEPTFKNKQLAFAHAKTVLTRPMYNGCKILVRKIYFKNDVLPEENCLQWEFDEKDI